MQYGYEFKIHHFVNEIFYYILQNLSALPELSRQQKKDIARIKTAMTYLEETYARKHTLLDIAQSCMLSRSECSRLFQRILHCSPVDCLIKVRILHSLPLIAAHELSMADIAAKTGFSGGSYFSETFKKSWGFPQEIITGKSKRPSASGLISLCFEPFCLFFSTDSDPTHETR